MTYQYVHTTTDIFRRGLNKQILRPYVKKYLYSLYNGLASNFGYNSLYKLSKNINDFYQNLYNDEMLIIDSGGYSIINGDVNPRDINKFIECYNYFLEYHKDIYNYILSLDIPILLEYPSYNTYENINKYNIQSYSNSKEILEKHPELYEKFIFVWHFKIKKQFDIWRNIYNEYYSDGKLKHHAIGGLVGLRGITGIKFSPFIAPAYRILKLIENDKHDYNIIHILGVYARHDRFFMQMLNKLFNDYYLPNKKIDITFDTINYTISGLYKIRDFPLVQLLQSNPKLTNEKKLGETLEKFIPNKIIFEQVLMEIDNIKKNKPIQDTRLLSLTYVIFSEIIDRMMYKFIKDEGIVELFVANPDYNKLKNKIAPILFKGAKNFPFAFNNMEKQMMNNFYWLSNFHRAYIDGASIERIDKGIEHFIKAINFPGDLN